MQPRALDTGVAESDPFSLLPRVVLVCFISFSYSIPIEFG